MNGQQRSATTATTIPRNQYTSLHDAIFDACNNAGITPPATLPATGQVRCPGIGKKPSNRACWINIKTDVAHIVDHSSGFTKSVFEGREFTAKDHVNFRRKQAAAARIDKAKRQAAIKCAQRAWDSAEPCTATKYTERKNIETYGCRWYPAQHCLLVPLRTIDGKLQSLQRLYDDGKKLCWPGAPTKAAFFMIGSIQSDVLICEGVATGASLYKHTGKPVACAMFASNLLAVAEAIRCKYPNLSMTICGDDDRGTVGNPGRAKATESAIAFGAKLTMPNLCTNCNCSDFNDQANCKRGANG